MKKAEENLSVLNKGLTFEGTLTATGTIIINGTVRGTLNGDTITIGNTGVIEAEAKVGNITIGGIFKGEIEASEKLVILSTGSCEGKIVCRDLVVEPGGILNGQVTRLPTEVRDTAKDSANPFKKLKKK